jgi:hypothetical protein
MGNNKVCDVKDCNSEATDILDCENVLHSFSVCISYQTIAWVSPAKERHIMSVFSW